MKMNKFFRILAINLTIFLFTAQATVTVEQNSDGLLIKTEYGEVKLSNANENDVLIQKLIKSPVFERLKYIHQYGPSHFVKQHIVYAGKIQTDYTRWEHSLGVFVLLRKFGATLEEQIAGLLHDSSHTVLSHVGCVLFKKDSSSKTAYQDDVLSDFLDEHGIAKFLTENKIKLQNVLIENVPVLKKSSPDLCADNLEYTLKGGLLAGFIKPDEISSILSNLKLDTQKHAWYFVDEEAAKKFAVASVKISETNSGSRWNAVLYKFTALTIQRAIEIDLIKKDEILFDAGDDTIWKKLALAQDEQIKSLRECITKHEDTYQILEGDSDASDCLKISTKFRGINPFIKASNTAEPKRLTEYNDEFKKLFYGIQYAHNTPKTIRFTNGYAFLATAIKFLGGINGQ